MQHKSLVLDANILIRAVLGNRTRSLIETYADRVALNIAEPNMREAETWLLTRLGPDRGIPEDLLRSLLEALGAHIQVVAEGLLHEHRHEALTRIGARDERDWPAVAASLLLGCPIWTEDADFFGVGIATWTSRTVELYLRD